MEINGKIEENIEINGTESFKMMGNAVQTVEIPDGWLPRLYKGELIIMHPDFAPKMFLEGEWVELSLDTTVVKC